MEGIFRLAGVGMSYKHDHDGVCGEISYKSWRGGWGLDTNHEEDLPVTYCPWCGEKLPEIVLMPPDPSDEQVRKWRKQTKKMAKKVMRWLRETQEGKGS